jgi:hypothetical protein
MLHIEQPTAGILRVFGFILLGTLPLMLFAGAVAGLGGFPVWAYVASIALILGIGALCAWGGTAIDVDGVSREVRVAPTLFGRTLSLFGKRARVPQRASMRVEARAVSDEDSTVIFHYIVIESEAGGFDVKAYRDIDEAFQTADAIADALGIRQLPPTLQAQVTA